jgi:hypothetical protein
MTRTILIAAALALAVTLPAVPAQAQTRAFVSTAGSDNNNCINTNSPCRHFQTAYNAMPNGGEIDVLDPGNYGALTVNHGLNIVGRGWATLTAVTNNAAITINSGTSDTIYISGILLDGANIANTNGIVFNSGASLTVRDSVIRNFSGDGILFQPNTSSASQIFVSNTTVSDNLNHGLLINPSGSGTTNGFLNRVEIQNNSTNGLFVQTGSQTISLTVSDSVSANNGQDGIVANSLGSGISVTVRNSAVVDNNIGLKAAGTGAIVRVTRSTITSNGTGWVNQSNGSVVSYGDNNIDDNTNSNAEPPNPLTYK